MKINQTKRELAGILSLALVLMTTTPVLAKPTSAVAPLELSIIKPVGAETPSGSREQAKYEMTLFDGSTFYHPEQVEEDAQGRYWLGNKEVIWLDDHARFEELLQQYFLENQFATSYAILSTDLLDDDGNQPDWDKIEDAMRKLHQPDQPTTAITSTVSRDNGKIVSDPIALKTGQYYNLHIGITTSAASANVMVDYNRSCPDQLSIITKVYDAANVEECQYSSQQLKLTDMQKKLIEAGRMSLVDENGDEIHQGCVVRRPNGINALEENFDVKFKLDYTETTTVVTNKAMDKVYLAGDKIPVKINEGFRLSCFATESNSAVCFSYNRKRPTALKVHVILPSGKSIVNTHTLDLTKLQQRLIKNGKMDLYCNGYSSSQWSGGKYQMKTLEHLHNCDFILAKTGALSAR